MAPTFRFLPPNRTSAPTDRYAILHTLVPPNDAAKPSGMWHVEVSAINSLSDKSQHIFDCGIPMLSTGTVVFMDGMTGAPSLDAILLQKSQLFSLRCTIMLPVGRSVTSMFISAAPPSADSITFSCVMAVF